MIDEKLVILYHVFSFHALFESELELRCSAIRPSTELHLPIIMYMPRSRLFTGMALKHRNAILLLSMCLPQIFCSYKSLRRYRTHHTIEKFKGELYLCYTRSIVSHDVGSWFVSHRLEFLMFTYF